MIEQFSEFFDSFKRTEQWQAMAATREDSPWHREESVAVHTQMLIDWYLKNVAAERTSHQQIFTLMSCLFHDVGKPLAEKAVFNHEHNKTIKIYSGHEILSARLWVDYAITNIDILSDKFSFNLDDVATIAFFIEHHLPYKIKNERKRKAIKQTIISRAGKDGHRAWLDFLISDQHGRISDNQQEKINNVNCWLVEWEKM